MMCKVCDIENANSFDGRVADMIDDILEVMDDDAEDSHDVGFAALVEILISDMDCDKETLIQFFSDIYDKMHGENVNDGNGD